MKNPENIQQILDKKAREKLEKDIAQFLQTVSDSPIWESISEVLFIEGNPDKKIKREDLRGFFWPPHAQYTSDSQGWDCAAKMMVDKLLPEYIETESKAFYEQVGNLQSQLENFEQEYSEPE